MNSMNWMNWGEHELCYNIVSGLALATLLPVQDDVIYQRFDVIVQCICETLNDIMKEDLDDESNTLVE